VDRIKAAFPPGRLIAPAPDLFDRAAVLFRDLHGHPSGAVDRLGPINDLLIALTAWRLGAKVVTSNVTDFRRIQRRLSGLAVTEP
jgi:predicted nucleic acid-binding protein